MRGGDKIEREDMSAQELRRLAGGVKDGRVSRRLLAMALVLEGASRKVAAESCGMDRQTLRVWVHRYNAEGVKGFGNRRGGGVKLRLTPDQMAQLATWVEDGPDPERDGVVRWRRVDLARRIEVVFGIKLHERTVGTYLARVNRPGFIGGFLVEILGCFFSGIQGLIMFLLCFLRRDVADFAV